MSGKEAEADVCCANCGIAAVDDIKLKDCDGCDLVKYCSDKCKQGHREEHKEECKRRVQELHDIDLLKQPDGSHLGECQLCFLPMPLHPKKSIFYSCCSNLACVGCRDANYMSNGNDNCPFCREPAADEDENKKRKMNRIKANDPAAMREMGKKLYREGNAVWQLSIGQRQLNWEI